MAGYNLETYRNMFAELAEGQGHKLDLLSNLPEVRIDSYINDAFADIADRHNLLKSRNGTADLTSGSYDVSLPTDRLGRRLETVQLLPATGTEPKALTFLTYDQFIARHNLDTPDTSEPAHWTYSRTDDEKILVGPAPNYTRTDAVLLTYPRLLSPLMRVYHSATPPTGSAITASVSKGSPTVTLSSSTPSGIEFRAGDDFGFIAGQMADGNSPAVATAPRRWYRSSTLATTTLTLAENFDERDVTDGTFVTAEVSPLERAFPGKFRWLAVQFAVAAYLETSNDADTMTAATRHLNRAAAASQSIRNEGSTPVRLASGPKVGGPWSRSRSMGGR